MAYEACDIEPQTMAGALILARVLTAYAEVEIVVGHYRGRSGQLVGLALAIPHAAERVNKTARQELKRPPGNIRRPTGLKIACFRNGPVRPGNGRLALASGARRIKTAVPSKEQTNCCGADTIHPVSTSAFPNAYLSVHPNDER